MMVCVCDETMRRGTQKQESLVVIAAAAAAAVAAAVAAAAAAHFPRWIIEQSFTRHPVLATTNLSLTIPCLLDPFFLTSFTGNRAADRSRNTKRGSPSGAESAFPQHTQRIIGTVTFELTVLQLIAHCFGSVLMALRDGIMRCYPMRCDITLRC